MSTARASNAPSSALRRTSRSLSSVGVQFLACPWLSWYRYGGAWLVGSVVLRNRRLYV